MSTNQVTSFDFSASGLAFRASDVALARRLAELGEALRGLAYDAWMAARAAFVSGAEADGKYQDGAKLWERTIARGVALEVIDPRPIATGDAATKKAEQRKVAQAKAAEAVKAGPAVLLEQAKAKAEAGAFKEAAQLQALAALAVKAAEKAASDAVADAVKPLIEAVNAARDAMRKANDVAGLELLALCAKALGEGKRAQVGEALAAFKAATPAKLAQLTAGAKPARQRKGKAAAVAA